MHNFKYLETFYNDDFDYTIPFRFCYFSRITESKGIFETIKIFKEINEDSVLCTLDIYGTIEDSAKEKFEEILNENYSFICYKGVVPAEKASIYIKDYYMMIFPTKDNGEGFPGSIIDAFAAGVPILSSRFLSFDDILMEKQNCLSFPFGKYEEMHNKVLYCITHPKEICKMRINCSREYLKYNPQKEIEILLNNL